MEPSKQATPIHGRAPGEVRSRRMHPRTLAAASRLTFLIVAGLQIPVAVDRLRMEYRGRIAATWLARLGAACEAAGWLTLLAIAIWGQFTAKGRRTNGGRLATTAVVGGVIAVIGELLQEAVVTHFIAEHAKPWNPFRLHVHLARGAATAAGAIACTVLATAWRCSLRGRKQPAKPGRAE